jgi:hypothetical protein
MMVGDLRPQAHLHIVTYELRRISTPKKACVCMKSHTSNLTVSHAKRCAVVPCVVFAAEENEASKIEKARNLEGSKCIAFLDPN